VFHAGGVHSSDPFYELEETEDEEDARLRDVFPLGGPKIAYVYDFGAGGFTRSPGRRWSHYIQGLNGENDARQELERIERPFACTQFRVHYGYGR